MSSHVPRLAWRTNRRCRVVYPERSLLVLRKEFEHLNRNSALVPPVCRCCQSTFRPDGWKLNLAYRTKRNDTMNSGSASKGVDVLVTSILFLVVAVLAVVFRLIARVGYLKNAGSDDLAIVIALVCLFPNV